MKFFKDLVSKKKAGPRTEFYADQLVIEDDAPAAEPQVPAEPDAAPRREAAGPPVGPLAAETAAAEEGAQTMPTDPMPTDAMPHVEPRRERPPAAESARPRSIPRDPRKLRPAKIEPSSDTPEKEGKGRPRKNIWDMPEDQEETQEEAIIAAVAAEWEAQKAVEVPEPATGRSGGRSGRVKTRMLGFQKADLPGSDIFAALAEVGAVDSDQQKRFPVGWLVVIQGPGRGASYTLYNGVSQIGRGEDQAIKLDFGDMSISRNNHAAIAYDDEQNCFFLGHGGKSNLVRLNGRPVLSTEELTNADLIRIGETTLRFVALCCPEFAWDWTMEMISSMQRRPDITFDVASALLQGKRATQQDAMASDFQIGSDLGFVVLADGMGGHEAGDIASKLVVTEVFSELKLQSGANSAFGANVSRILRNAAKAANEFVRAHMAAHPETDGMGATLIAPVLIEDRLFWISIGDSPLFLFRQGKLKRLNEDHSLAPQIDFMIKSGMIGENFGKDHPDRSCLTSVLVGELIPKIDCPAEPIGLAHGDVVIVASDGLQFIAEDRIRAIVAENAKKSGDEIVKRLMEELERIDHPDQDNVAVSVIKVAQRAKRRLGRSLSGINPFEPQPARQPVLRGRDRAAAYAPAAQEQSLMMRLRSLKFSWLL